MVYRQKRFPQRSLADRVERIGAALDEWASYYKTLALDENFERQSFRSWKKADDRWPALEEAARLANELYVFLAAMR